MTFNKDALKTLGRSIKTLYSLSPTVLLNTILHSIFSALVPFVALYFASKILNLLVNYRLGLDPLLYTNLGWMLGTLFFLTLLVAVFDWLKTLENTRVNAMSQAILNEKTVNMDYAAIEDTRTHDLRAKIESYDNMIGGIWNNFNMNFSGLIRRIVTLFTAILVMPNLLHVGSLTSLVATLIFVGLIAIGFFFNARFMTLMGKAFHRAFGGVMQVNKEFSFYANHIANYNAGKDARLYHQKSLLMSLVNNMIHNRMKTGFSQIQVVTTKNRIIASFFAHSTLAIVYAYVGFKALVGEIGLGEILLYIGAIKLFIDALEGVIRNIFALYDNNRYCVDYFAYLDLPSEMHLGTLPVEKRDDDAFEIAFNNVSFKYPGQDQFALKNVNLKLNLGERLAIVGMNGSGKTTLIKLLCRLYDPTEGTITLNNIDIRKYDYDEYMQLFSVVFQDFKLFGFSLGQNVATCRSSDDKFKEDRVKEVLEQVGFADKLQQMPRGLNTSLYKYFDEEGEEISGGEAQKVALARAVYRNAPLMILDEPTAALDPVAEYEIYTKFNDIVQTKTAFYISHRLSSCRFCDRVAVFKNGELIELGNHQHLVENETGHYAELWRAQAHYYTG